MARSGRSLHQLGQGITTEALQRGIRDVFDTSLHWLNAVADVCNTCSNLVLEKCGFVRKGTVRQGKMVSTCCNYHIYGLLKSALGDDLPIFSSAVSTGFLISLQRCPLRQRFLCLDRIRYQYYNAIIFHLEHNHHTGGVLCHLKPCLKRYP